VRGFWPVYKRELFSMFITPLAWVIIVVFLIIQGLHFSLLLGHFARQPDVVADHGPVQAFFGGTIFLYLPLLILCPGLTMRVFAEERRSGTIETLMTAPISTTGLVLAKWLAAVTTYVAMWAPTVLYMAVIRKTGDLDWHVVATGYLGVLGVGCSYLALGTLMSAMTRSQLMALVLGMLVTVGLFVIGIGEMVLDDGWARDFCSYVSVWSQMDDFSKGIVDLRRVAFDTTMTVVPLFATVRIVDAWRWGLK
jgi:ABC-2 type transport system permease protein